MVPSATRVTVRLVVCLCGTAVLSHSSCLVKDELGDPYFSLFNIHYYILEVHQLIDWPSLVYSPRHCEIWVLSAVR